MKKLDSNISAEEYKKLLEKERKKYKYNIVFPYENWSEGDLYNADIDPDLCENGAWGVGVQDYSIIINEKHTSYKREYYFKFPKDINLPVGKYDSEVIDTEIATQSGIVRDITPTSIMVRTKNFKDGYGLMFGVVLVNDCYTAFDGGMADVAESSFEIIGSEYDEFQDVKIVKCVLTLKFLDVKGHESIFKQMKPEISEKNLDLLLLRGNENDIPLIRYLIDQGVDINNTYLGITPLEIALIKATPLDNPHAPIMLMDLGCKMPDNFLHYCFDKQMTEVIMKGIGLGADINYQYNDATPFTRAVNKIRSHTETKHEKLAILLQAGANIEMLTDDKKYQYICYDLKNIKELKGYISKYSWFKQNLPSKEEILKEIDLIKSKNDKVKDDFDRLYYLYMILDISDEERNAAYDELMDEGAEKGSGEFLIYKSVWYANQKKIKECAELNEKAAKEYYSTAIQNLFRIYFHGMGDVKKDYKKAEYYASLMADKYNEGGLYYNLASRIQDSDPDKYAYLMVQALLKGNTSAINDFLFCEVSDEKAYKKIISILDERAKGKKGTTPEPKEETKVTHKEEEIQDLNDIITEAKILLDLLDKEDI